MNDTERAYLRLKKLLCAKCPIRRTCPQFPEQMDACADALLIQEEARREPEFTVFMGTDEEEDS